MNDKTKRVIRTVIQVILALAVAAPIYYEAIAQQDPTLATGAMGLILFVAGAICRVMALPITDRLISMIAPWLAINPTSELPGSDEWKNE